MTVHKVGGGPTTTGSTSLAPQIPADAQSVPLMDMRECLTDQPVQMHLYPSEAVTGTPCYCGQKTWYEPPEDDE